MGRGPLIFGFLAICVLAFSGGNALRNYLKPLWPNPENQRQVKLGAVLYQRHCADCHGINLEGEANWRSPKQDGSMRAPPHDQTGHTWHHPDKLLFDYTYKGGQGMGLDASKSNMPPFKGVMEDYEIWATLAFIKSRWTPEIIEQQRLRNPSRTSSILNTILNR